ncbi:hypothetical protein [Nocardia sienata]|uniref:hypothetical protein n=1 Tax=Nocardia sienata TaxID=248552 RepID=UPI0007A4BDDF|nr:hypothetical protein [Nocardia sienata]
MASLDMPALPSAVNPGPVPDRKAVSARRIRWFAAETITYNVIEAIIALTEGARGKRRPQRLQRRRLLSRTDHHDRRGHRPVPRLLRPPHRKGTLMSRLPESARARVGPRQPMPTPPDPAALPDPTAA